MVLWIISFKQQHVYKILQLLRTLMPSLVGRQELLVLKETHLMCKKDTKFSLFYLSSKYQQDLSSP